MIKVLFSICNLTWRVNNYISRQGKCTNRRNESTIIIMKYCTVLYNHYRVLFNLIKCCWLKKYFCWTTTFSVVLKLFWDTDYFSFQTVEIFPSSMNMATFLNKRRLAAMAIESKEYARNNQSQNSAAPGITEGYIAQVSEEIKGRVTEKLSQEFSRIESHIVGALSKLDECLLNSHIRTFSGTVPGTFRNADVKNQEPTEDRSHNDLHPEVEFSACCAGNLTGSDPDEASHKHKFLIPKWRAKTTVRCWV